MTSLKQGLEFGTAAAYAKYSDKSKEAWRTACKMHKNQQQELLQETGKQYNKLRNQ
jgi:hypothetical protein